MRTTAILDYHLQELEKGSGDLENVLRIKLQPPEQPTPAVPAPSAAGRAQPVKTYHVFLAPSSELQQDREDFVLYFLEQNDLLIERGIRLQIHRWEHFLDAISSTRLQDEYNKAVRSSDVVVCLFHTKTGKFTEEEFDTTHRQFLATGKPLLFTYFKNQPFSADTPRADRESLWNFQDKLNRLKHFCTKYESIDDLKLQFRDQLDRLFVQDGITG
jgi:hypothetical protein